MVLFMLSTKLTTAASSIFLQATAPLWVVLLSPWLLGEQVRRRDLVYMVALALGLACFFIGVDNASVTSLLEFTVTTFPFTKMISARDIGSSISDLDIKRSCSSTVRRVLPF